jgi:hypothetical protein
MTEPSDKPPRLYTMKEALKKLDISTTAGRDWIILYERLTAPLPRESDKQNATRLVSSEVIKHIRAARSTIANSGYGLTQEDALRGILGLEPAPIREKPLDQDPQAFAAAVALAVRTELQPLFEKIQTLEDKLNALESRSEGTRVLTAPGSQIHESPDRQEAVERVLESGQEAERHEQKPPRPNTFLNRLRNVFGRSGQK